MTFLSECLGMLRSKTEARWGLEMINLARVVPATEVTSGGETIASGEKIGKSGGKGGGQKVGGGKVTKVPKVAKERFKAETKY